MYELIKREIEAAGFRAEIIPVDALDSIIEDIEKIKNSGWLNDFQSFIVNDLYDLNLPEINFQIKSIIIMASSSRLVRLTFNHKGKKVNTVLPPTYAEYTTAPKRMEKHLEGVAALQGFSISYAPKLPYKLTSVKSGLSKYGRNNISFIEGWGSFYSMAAFYSDLPFYRQELCKIEQMDICKSCNKCLNNCPTKAIQENRFLIDNKRCLTYFNEAGGWDFPEWIDKSAHNSLYGCVRCQTVCPLNKANLGINRTVEFTEEETDILLDEAYMEKCTGELKEKIASLCMENFLSAVPRNLKILLERQDIEIT